MTSTMLTGGSLEAGRQGSAARPLNPGTAVPAHDCVVSTAVLNSCPSSLLQHRGGQKSQQGHWEHGGEMAESRKKKPSTQLPLPQVPLH